ncbi:MAG TPA: dihydrofolate reductase family protein [Solirubrobacteraceae bacterium]|jgi:riboflavin biosynthesis pyrimidine reductase
MRFNRAVPAGPPVSPEEAYAGLDLARRAPANRPYVVCNFVSSADGKATLGGRSAALGGEGDRAVFGLLRTQVDAVLAGTRTLRIEHYGALVRDPELRELRVREGRAPQPLAVVVSRSGVVPFEVPLFADPASKVVLYLPANATAPPCAAQLTVHPSPATGELADVLHSLRTEHDVRSLLCEGGPTMLGELIVEDLVDELFLTLAPALVGGAELGLSTGSEPPAARAMRMVAALEHDGYLFLRYARQAASGGVEQAEG